METKYKSFRTLLQAKIQSARKQCNKEIEIYTEELLRDYDRIQKETIATVNLTSWKGKDQIQYIESVDKFIIITHQKKDQDSLPVEHKKEISKETINEIIEAINTAKISTSKEKLFYIKTRDIAEAHAIAVNMKTNPEGRALWDSDGLFIWQLYFGSRFLHTQINIILRLLDDYKVIKYRAGRTTVLNNKFKFQTTL